MKSTKKFLFILALAIGAFCYAGTDMARNHKSEATKVLKETTVKAANSASAALRQ